MTRRAPSQLWAVLDSSGEVLTVYRTKRDAEEPGNICEDKGERLAGPYVLAERKREK